MFKKRSQRELQRGLFNRRSLQLRGLGFRYRAESAEFVKVGSGETPTTIPVAFVRDAEEQSWDSRIEQVV